MTQADLDAAAGARAGVAASLEVTLGRLADRLDKMARRDSLEAGLQRAVQPVLIPAVQFPVSAGAVSQPLQAQMLGPEDGQVWHVHRLTVAGLSAPTTQNGSLVGTGSQTSPAANTTIASVAVTPGVYQVQWSVMLGGTVAAADADNFALFNVGGVSPFTSLNPGSVGGPWPQAPRTMVVTASGVISVRNVGAGTASSVYSAQLSVTPVDTGDVIGLYRELGTSGPAAGNPQNLLWVFTTATPVWEPKGLFLRSPDQLLLDAVAGQSLLSASVILSGEAVAVEAPWLSRYLL